MRSIFAFTVVTVAMVSACAKDSSERVGDTRLKVYIGNDGLAGPDGDSHPQVVRLAYTLPGGGDTFCTGWLSSSNTITTAAHCFRQRQNTGVSTNFRIVPMVVNETQRAAFANLGAPVAVLEHPQHQRLTTEDGRCSAYDVAVLVYDPAKRIPRSVVKPLPVVPESSAEPACEKPYDSYCVQLLGVGYGGPFTDNQKCVQPTSGTVYLNMEAGLRNGSCVVNDDALSGEYDYDDSQPCDGDSGAPIVLRETGAVLAMHSTYRQGDGVDDSTGPILWINRGSPNSARQWLWPTALDQDGDGRPAVADNCDLVSNADQRDSDGDGVGDVCDNCPSISNANQSDQDGDGIGNACDDGDGDGLTDEDELQRGTKPDTSDSDGDGLDDGDEVRRGTNPLANDSDGDLLPDGEEVRRGTNPLDGDTDDDGLSDGDEVLTHATNPLAPDTDGDELSDGNEVLVHRTNPLAIDTDGDTLTDGAEVLRHRTNPLDSDSDDDFLDDGQEIAFGSNPLDGDTDDDGIVDGRDSDFLVAALARVPDASVKPARNPLLNHLEQADRNTLAGDLDGAANRLVNLRKHLDGCGTAPGNDDWIVTCAEQLEIRRLLDLLITNLRR